MKLTTYDREEPAMCVTDKPLEFEKQPPVDAQDCRKVTDHVRGIYKGIYPSLIKENQRMSSTCNRPVGLANTQIDLNR